MIEGALEDSPSREWTLDSLEERVGGNEVHVRANTNCEDYRVRNANLIVHSSSHRLPTFLSLVVNTTFARQLSEITSQISEKITSERKARTWLCKTSRRHFHK